MTKAEALAGMLDRSRQALRAARLLLGADDAEGSINRSYYAAFYLASAALWLVGERPRTHAGAVDRFWVRFVQSGRFPSETAQALRGAFRARERADYDYAGRFDAMAAAELLRDVAAFAEAAEALVQELWNEEKP